LPTMSAGPLTLVISITSDTICPFCFIGLRKLQAALSSSPLTSSNSTSKVFEYHIKFLPFQLDPSLPSDKGVSKKERYISKFGSAERVAGMETMMLARGKEVGIAFSHGGLIRDTTLSHRLLERAYEQGGSPLQLALVEKLFHAYFENESDPGDPSALSTLSTQAGVFPSESAASTFLSSSELGAQVDDLFKLGYKKGITGVPHFEIEVRDGQVDNFGKSTTGSGKVLAQAEVPGAQDSVTFVSVFQKLLLSAKAKGAIVDVAQGISC